MISVVGITLLLAIAVTADDRHCVGRPNGFKYQSPHDCSLFFTCLNQSALVDMCPDGLYFDDRLQKCGDPKTVMCRHGQSLPACNRETDGAVIGHDDCTKFYICNGVVWKIGQCEDGLSFVKERGACQYLPVDQCPEAAFRQKLVLSETTMESLEESHIDTRCLPRETKRTQHLAHPTSCSKFFKCFMGRAYLEQCPAGLHFSVALDRCEDAAVANCKIDKLSFNAEAPKLQKPSLGAESHKKKPVYKEEKKQNHVVELPVVPVIEMPLVPESNIAENLEQPILESQEEQTKGTVAESNEEQANEAMPQQTAPFQTIKPIDPVQEPPIVALPDRNRPDLEQTLPKPLADVVVYNLFRQTLGTGLSLEEFKTKFFDFLNIAGKENEVKEETIVDELPVEHVVELPEAIVENIIDPNYGLPVEESSEETADEVIQVIMPEKPVEPVEIWPKEPESHPLEVETSDEKPVEEMPQSNQKTSPDRVEVLEGYMNEFFEYLSQSNLLNNVQPVEESQEKLEEVGDALEFATPAEPLLVVPSLPESAEEDLENYQLPIHNPFEESVEPILPPPMSVQPIYPVKPMNPVQPFRPVSPMRPVRPIHPKPIQPVVPTPETVRPNQPKKHRKPKYKDFKTDKEYFENLFEYYYPSHSNPVGYNKNMPSGRWKVSKQNPLPRPRGQHKRRSQPQPDDQKPINRRGYRSVAVAVAATDEYEAGIVDARCPRVDGKKVVHFEHPTECNKFYKCSFGLAFLNMCPPGLHWARKLDRCDYKQAAMCPYRH